MYDMLMYDMFLQLEKQSIHRNYWKHLWCGQQFYSLQLDFIFLIMNIKIHVIKSQRKCRWASQALRWKHDPQHKPDSLLWSSKCTSWLTLFPTQRPTCFYIYSIYIFTKWTSLNHCTQVTRVQWFAWRFTFPNVFLTSLLTAFSATGLDNTNTSSYETSFSPWHHTVHTLITDITLNNDREVPAVVSLSRSTKASWWNSRPSWARWELQCPQPL